MEAQRLEDHGADAVVAQGAQAGAHRASFDLASQLDTLVLFPEVVDAVKIPFIAAARSADGRAIAAALAFGASCVQIETESLLCS